jgi:hypothetical protein
VNGPRPRHRRSARMAIEWASPDQLAYVPRHRAGNIGEPVRRIEFEPLPDEAPIEEPAAPTRREAVPA